jgi:divalent metal cation (Fe/Co/Zn/Cd) transporter
MSGMNVVADRKVLDPGDLETLVGSFPGVRSCRRVRTRGFEDSVFVDLTVLLDPDLSLREAHELCDRIEERFRSTFPQIADIVIHPEPDLTLREEAVKKALDRRR